ncbi:MAG: hypothetical protein IPM47_09055 [Sphingobacteriales bacterium]|nr:MAG: hypothetical protein IPM47_09055 [Sphingobacteriales bacterium]
MSNTNKELVTVEEKLRALYHLQQIDSKIDEIRSLRGELPVEVQDMEDEIEGLNLRIRNLQGDIDKLNEAISASNLKIEESQTLISRYEGQQMNVKNNREFEALAKEIENQQLDIELAKKTIKQTKEVIDKNQKLLDEATLKADMRKKDLVLKREELEKTIEETRIEEEELLVKSNSAAAMIEERLISAYNRIRNSYKNGLAVARISRASCGGCFGTIPPQRQLEIGQRKKILLCEHCGRILVDADIESDLSEVTIQVEYVDKD